MRLARLSLLLVLASGLQARAQSVFYIPQVGDGEILSISLQTGFVFINTGAATSVRIEFKRAPDGEPMTLDLGALGEASEFTISLDAGESVSFSSQGVGTPQVGYAKITVGGQLVGGGGGGTSVGGTAIFTQTDRATSTVLSEAGVPLVSELTDFTVFVDTIGERNTGLAIVNAELPAQSGQGKTAEGVTLSLYDTLFDLIATTDIPLPAGYQVNNFIPGFFSDVPEALEMEGTVTVTPLGAPIDLAAVTLRTNSAGGTFPGVVPTLTAFPVTPGTSGLAASGTVSRISADRIEVTLDLRGVTDSVTGAIFSLYTGDGRTAEVVRQVESVGLVDLVFEIPEQLGDAAVTRVETRLILRNARIGSKFRLR